VAWSSISGLNVVNDKTAGSSIATSATVTAGRGVFVAVAKDNASAADGENNEVTSVADTLSNTYTLAKQFTNSQGGANSGAHVALYYSKITTGGSTTITANFSSGTVTASAMILFEGQIASGATLSVAGSSTLANDGADPGSMSIAGLTSGEHLYVRAVALETPIDGTVGTPTSSYTVLGSAEATGGGGAATNMAVWVEYRIFTGTGDTSDPTVASADCASVFVAFRETAPATPAALNFRPERAFLHNLLR
jgi:hypothetical protein